MKHMIKRTLQSLLVIPALALSLSMVAPVAGAEEVTTPPTCTNEVDITNAANCSAGTGQQTSLTGSFTLVTNVLLFIIGAISVIMLIIGGIRYTVSGGDSAAVTSAKNTILYAIVGIIVALLAYAVVNFVVGSFVAP
jgi:hypothetical protein